MNVGGRKRLLAAVLAAAWLAAVPAPVQADSGPQRLVVPSLSKVVLDEAHGHLFMSAGYSGAGVGVTDLRGAHVKTIDELSGAHGMALTRDGTAL